MPHSKDPGNNKEVTSFSLSSNTITLLDKACEIFDYDNKSKLVERAIKEYVIRKLTTNPLFWSKVYKEFLDLSL